MKTAVRTQRLSLRQPLLVLASASPRRQELLKALGVPFKVKVSRYEECNDGVRSPRALVLRHARNKAADIAQSVRSGIVIGADTIVWRGRTAYGKPADMADARRMLRELQGKTHDVYTAIAAYDAATDRWASACVRTSVTMRPLSDAEIARYFSLVNPLDKAGAYAIQEAGGIIIERISGCYYNVIGLPVAALDALLRKLGYSLLQVSHATRTPAKHT